LLLLAIAILGLQTASFVAPAAEERGGRDFVLYTAAGDAPIGPLRELGEQWSVRLGGLKPRALAGAEVVALRRAGTPLPAYPADEQVLLLNGDRVPGKVLKLDGERLRVSAQLGAEQKLDLPLSAVAVMWLAAPHGEDRPEWLRRKLLTARRRRDVVLLRNGDAVEGTVTALDRTATKPTLRVEVDRRELAIELEKVAAVAFSTDLALAPRPRQTYGHLVLANGCRLALASARADGETLTGKTLFGAPVTVPVAEVCALDLRQGCAVYLSDLKPARYEFTPGATDLRWPFVADGAVAQAVPAGLELRLAGGTYDKGLGLHAASRLTFALGGAYRRFEAVVGIDDQAGDGARQGQGSARIAVLIDGKPQDLGKGADLSARDRPLAVSVNVAGAEELTLVVEFGRRLDVQARVNWADARLIK
jgi:hypothetical protein